MQLWGFPKSGTIRFTFKITTIAKKPSENTIFML
jgi:hypothetical protein